MKSAVFSLLRDRRRSQHGGVLSGVLIITAFIAIISAALMTELSTNLLLSRNLVNRAANEATDNSAVELTLSELQSTQLNAPCPAPQTATVNNLTASAKYLTCWATVREPQKITWVGSASGHLATDGTHVQVNGLNDYVVGDSGGNVLDIPFGWTAPRWTLSLGGQVTATPLVMAKPGSGNQVFDVIPAAGASCGSSPDCLDVMVDQAGSSSAPPLACVAAASSPITSQPARSPTQSGLVYYGFGSQLAATDVSLGTGVCDYESTVSIPNGDHLSAPAIAFACKQGCGNTNDHVYAVVDGGPTSQLLQFDYGKSSLSFAGSINLPFANASGLAVNAASLPVSVAITFGGGGVALVNISAGGSMSVAGASSVGAGVSDAPYWCHCPVGDLIAVGAQNGGLYLYNAALQLTASSALGGAAITTTPGVDAAGNWYFGANDGFVHELQVQAGQSTMQQVDTFGTVGQVGSGVQVGQCSIGICVYLGSGDDAYLVPLDARRAIISACISSSPPTCSGGNPKLWASVEVGAAGNPQTVHVEGWSYYSG